jgi:hypothetical protein
MPFPTKPPLHAHTTVFVALSEQVALLLHPPLFVAQGLAAGFCGNRKHPENRNEQQRAEHARRELKRGCME